MKGFVSPEALRDNVPVHFPETRVGISGESFFQSLDRFFEKVSMALSFKKETKIKKNEKYSHERLEEISALLLTEKYEQQDIFELIDDYVRNQEKMSEMIKEVNAMHTISELHRKLAISMYFEDLWLMHNLIPSTKSDSQVRERGRDAIHSMIRKRMELFQDLGKEKLDQAFSQIMENGTRADSHEQKTFVSLALAQNNGSLFQPLFTASVYQRMMMDARETKSEDVVSVVIAKQDLLLESLAISLSQWFETPTLQQSFERWILMVDIDREGLEGALIRLQQKNFLELQGVYIDHLLMLNALAGDGLEEPSMFRLTCLEQESCTSSGATKELTERISAVYSPLLLRAYKEDFAVNTEKFTTQETQQIQDAIAQRDAFFDDEVQQNQELKSMIEKELRSHEEIKDFLKDHEKELRRMIASHSDGYTQFIADMKDALDLDFGEKDYDELREEIRNALQNPPELISTLDLIQEFGLLMEEIDFTDEQLGTMQIILNKLNENVNEEGYAVIVSQINEFFESLPFETQLQITELTERTFASTGEDEQEGVSEEHGDENAEGKTETEWSEESLGDEDTLEQPEVMPEDVSFDDTSDQEEHAKDDFFFEE